MAIENNATGYSGESVEIECEWMLDDFMQANQRFVSGLEKNRLRPIMDSILAGAILGVVGSFLSIAVFDVPLGDQFFAGFLTGLFVGLFSMLGAMQRRYKTCMMKFVEYYKARAPQIIALSSKGFGFTAGTQSMSVEWCDVTDVVPCPGGIAICQSMTSIVPIPDRHLPPNLTRTELLAKVATWRGAAND